MHVRTPPPLRSLSFLRCYQPKQLLAIQFTFSAISKCLSFFFCQTSKYNSLNYGFRRRIQKYLKLRTNMPFTDRNILVNFLPSLQSLRGKLQGRMTTQGNPVVITGNEFTEYSFLLFWFPCFNNIEIVALLVPVICTGNCQFILQGFNGCFNTL